MGYLNTTPRTQVDFDLGGADTASVYSGDFYIINDANTADNLTIQLASGATGNAFINFGNPGQRDSGQLWHDNTNAETIMSVQNLRIQEWGDGYTNLLTDTYVIGSDIVMPKTSGK